MHGKVEEDEAIQVLWWLPLCPSKKEENREGVLYPAADVDVDGGVFELRNHTECMAQKLIKYVLIFLEIQGPTAGESFR